MTAKTSFGQYADYYDLLYADKDYPGEAHYLSSLLNRFGQTGSSILEMGCGTGKHAMELARLGYSVLGIDASPTMLEQAQARTSSVAASHAPIFTSGDVRNFRPNQKFDATAACFHVINYQLSDDDLALTFETAAQNIRSGGTFVFDSWYGPAVLSQKPEVRVKRCFTDELEVVRIAEPTLIVEENVVSVKYTLWVRNSLSGTVKTFSEEHRVRYLFTPEIKRLCSGTGLKLLHTEEWLTGKAPSLETWGLCYVARR